MLRVRTQLGGITNGPGLTTFHFAGSTQTEADDAALAVAAFWDSVDTAMHTSTTWQVLPEVVYADNTTGQPIGIYPVTGDSGTGGAAGTPLASATQGLIRWRTGTFFNGKEIRGRTFIPGPTTNHLANGGPAAPYITALQTAADILLAASPAFGIWSERAGQWEEATSRSVWTDFAVLRSRRD